MSDVTKITFKVLAIFLICFLTVVITFFLIDYFHVELSGFNLACIGIAYVFFTIVGVKKWI